MAQNLVLKEGFLLKKGGMRGGRRNWTKRWCVLKSNSLQFFRDPQVRAS